MTLSMSALSAVVKERWPDGLPKNFLYQNHAFLSMMQKEEDFHEQTYNVPAQTTLSGGRSHDFATAQAMSLNNTYVRFQVTPVTDYDYVTFEGRTLRSLSKANADQVVKTIEREFEGAMGRLGNNVASEAFRNNTGARCRVHASTAPSTTTLTLDYPSAARFFYVGARIVASETDGGALRDADYVTVTAVDYEAGTLTGDGTWTTVITGLAVGDYLYISGDTNATTGAAQSSKVAAAGLDAWCPSSAPSATTFFGVNRALYPQALGGWRISNTGESIETVFIKANAVAQVAGFTLDSVLIHPNDVARLEKAKEGTKEVSVGKYEIGVRRFEAYGSTFYVDPDCQEGTAWAVDIKGGAFKHLINGKQPAIDETDGNKFSRLATSDGYESRIMIDHNFASFNPSRIVRIPLPTT
jgi:hypothetical protein